MMRETPSITGSAYTSTTMPLANINQAMSSFTAIGDMPWQNQQQDYRGVLFGQEPAPKAKDKPQPKKDDTAMTTRRLVQVFIADPDENVPLESALLYKGEPKFTDATDQELFFEIDINSILKTYNEKRVTVVNKKVKERTEMLEPAKIRDLKMVVVKIAEF